MADLESVRTTIPFRRAIGVALSICFALGAVAFVNGVFEKETKFSSKAARNSLARTQSIKAELKDMGEHPWAGEYYEGDGLGTKIALLIAPKNGFVYKWHGGVDSTTVTTAKCESRTAHFICLAHSEKTKRDSADLRTSYVPSNGEQEDVSFRRMES